MAKILINTKVNEELRRQAQEKAESQDITLTQLVEEALALYVALDSNFLMRLKAFSAKQNLPESLVIQNLVISWMARRDAFLQVMGPEKAKKAMPEFRFTDKGPLTGDELYHELKLLFEADYLDLESLRNDLFRPVYVEDFLNLNKGDVEGENKSLADRVKERRVKEGFPETMGGWTGDAEDPREKILKAKREHEAQEKDKE